MALKDIKRILISFGIVLTILTSLPSKKTLIMMKVIPEISHSGRCSPVSKFLLKQIDIEKRSL